MIFRSEAIRVVPGLRPGTWIERVGIHKRITSRDQRL